MALEDKRRKQRLEQWELGQAAKIMNSKSHSVSAITYSPIGVQNGVFVYSNCNIIGNVKELLRTRLKRSVCVFHGVGLWLSFPQRVIANILTHWTNRVIEIKSRELDIAQRSNTSLLRYAHNTNHSTEITELSFGIEMHLTSGKHVADSTRKKSVCWRTIC